MKRFAMKTLVVAAALAAVAVGASAQSMKAEIPFTFRAGGAVQEAGSYRIHVTSSGVVHLMNADTQKSVLVLSRYRTDKGKSADGKPNLMFACAGSNCVLTSLWNGSDPSALVLGSPATARNEIAETRVVNLSFVKSE